MLDGVGINMIYSGILDELTKDAGINKEQKKIALSPYVDKIQTITPGKTKRIDTGMMRTVTSKSKKLGGSRV